MASKKKITALRSNNTKQQSGWAEKQKKEKKPGRKRFIFLSIGAAVGLFVGILLFSIYKWFTVSDFFQVTSIKIVGVERLDKQEVLVLSGVTIQTNLLAMRSDRVKQKIESHDWIEKAVIKRRLPSDLIIKIQERTPVALLNTEKGLVFIDKRGVAFAKAMPPDELDYPVITGLEKRLESASEKKENYLENPLLFIKYAGNGSTSLPRQNISEIHVDENGECVLYLADYPIPIYLGAEVSQKRYYRLAKVLYWLYKKREFSDVNFIRMDYMNNKVLVRKKM